ncbi:MAG TPA: sodium:proton antiporter [Candidatus Dormibacteraeota bacterium]|nr:sodium:proton antiporter [Candidatus Dormibacteraeota bacterium]
MAPSFEFVITAFLAIALTASIISSRTRAPYTIILVLFGIAIAGSSLSSILSVNLLYDSLIGGGLFVGLVLPPLLFETMMNIRYDEFRAVVTPAIRLATVGVAIATIVGGLLLWQIAQIPIIFAFVFSSLIAPTDTATVLEIFRRARLPRKLSTLMEVEASFNDATGITIFTIIVTSIGVSQPSLLGAFLNFARIFGGGVLIGIAVAIGAHLLSRLVDDPMSQTMVTITTVYGAYTAAEALGVSGLVAVSVAGLYYGNSTVRTWVRPQTTRTVRNFWRIMTFIANSLAFLYIGLSTDLATIRSDLIPIGLAFSAVIVSRVASVYPLLGISRVDGESIPMSWKNVAMLGGMRGALSIALVASLKSCSPTPVPGCIPSLDIGTLHLITSMVLGVAFLSILLQGFLLSRYISKKFPKRTPQRGVHPILTSGK